MSLLASLRDRTHTHHVAVEQELALLDRPWTATGYRAVLRRFLGYYDPLEGRIEAAADWAALGFAARRCRATLETRPAVESPPVPGSDLGGTDE